MKNRLFVMGMLVLVLAFGICMTGCLSTTANYYDLGNVSEENCALIQVTPIYNGDSDFRFTDLVQIDGQGNVYQWGKPSSMGDGITTISKAIVRVTPGEHTFTVTFIRATEDVLGTIYENRKVVNTKEIPITITYNVKAGYGYAFDFSAKWRGDSPFAGIIAEITISESPVDENGKFGKIGSNKEVGKNTETIPFTL